MNFGACVLIQNRDDGAIFAVSRKGFKDDFGLPGGKVEIGETPLDAAIRELEEETGLKVRPEAKITLVYQSEDKGYLNLTYQVSVNDIIGTLPPANELVPGKEADTVMGWINDTRLTEGTFSRYNKGLVASLGIGLKRREPSMSEKYALKKEKEDGYSWANE